MSGWTHKIYVNEWTGEERQTWRKSTYTAGGSAVLYEVYELGGRYYWSANIRIANRPDLSRIAYGVYAAIPQALPLAKMRASRLGKAALRAARTPRHMARAA